MNPSLASSRQDEDRQGCPIALSPVQAHRLSNPDVIVVGIYDGGGEPETWLLV